MITRDELETLLNTPVDPAVSIYTPTNLPSLAIRQDSIRLGNQVDDVHNRLSAMGWRSRDADALVAPIRKLLENDEFWKNNTQGLAIFLGAGQEPRIWRMPIPVEELVIVGSCFHIAPLLPLFEADDGFYVLSLSARRTKLFRASRHSMCEVPDTGLPQGVDATVADSTDYQQSVHANPNSSVRGGLGGLGGEPGAVPARQSIGDSPEEARKGEMLHYLEKLASAVDEKCAKLQSPIVLAAGPEIAGNFRARSTCRTLWPETLEINPDGLDAGELHRRAWALVEPRMAGKLDAVIDRFNRSSRTSVEPAELLKAASGGRVDTLILAEGEHLWGRFDAAGDRVESHQEPEITDDDLLDLAARQTLLNGGDVKIVARDQVPHGAMIAGIMRY